MTRVIFHRHTETKAARVTAWAFSGTHVHLDMEATGFGLSSVLRLSPDEARAIADALLAAADAATVVEVPA